MDTAARREERRSRRVVRRMDREAARLARARYGPQRPRVGRALVVVLATAGAGVGAVAASDARLVDWFTQHAYVDIDGRSVRIPDPQPADGRLVEAVEVTTEGRYAFLHLDEAGAPVGYDPCRPVRYVLSLDGMPEGAQPLVEEAAAIVGAAAGLALEYAGTTDEAPAVERTLIQPERYGDEWAPVLIAWADEATLPELAGDVAGVGGSAAVPGAHGEGQWLAAGRVVLDLTDVSAMLERPGGSAQVRALIVHEMAHVLGLDHVDDPAELMFPISATRRDLGPGDRAGLALVGQVACQGD